MEPNNQKKKLLIFTNFHKKKVYQNIKKNN